MLMTSPFWIAATAAETYSRLATMMFWGMMTPATDFYPIPVEVKQQNDVRDDQPVETLPLAA
ncbi:MAG: hypothetical protein ACTHNN_03345 [Xanthobacteraceae bacterium]